MAPHFDAPYLATSVAEFWGRRWNLCAGNALRWAVQEPALERRLVRPARRPPARSLSQRRLGAAAAAFCASGLMHEIQFMCDTGLGLRGNGELVRAEASVPAPTARTLAAPPRGLLCRTAGPPRHSV